MSHFIKTNNIKIHYLEYKGDGPTIILMHGLTANAHAFDGLIAAGLNTFCNVISIDLRGRGESDQPEGYSMEAHAKDVVGFMDKMNFGKVIIGGHSFGALLSLYLATHHSERVEKLLILDAGAKMHENTKEMLAPSLSRLGQVYPSFQFYLDKVKAAPYLDFWEKEMENYYRADVKVHDDKTVSCIPQLERMVSAVNGVLSEPWKQYLENIPQKSLLINAPGIYTMGAALLPKENALDTVNMMKNCSYVEVPGNHQTMLYGEGAKQIVQAIKEFLNN